MMGAGFDIIMVTVNLSRTGEFLFARVRCWLKIASHFHVTGVRCGHNSDSWPSKLSVRFQASQTQMPLLLSQCLGKIA